MGARAIVVVVAALAAGLVGTVVAVGDHGGDDAFLLAQRSTAVTQAADVERVVRTAPDPSTGKGTGTSARCTPSGPAPLRNPWTCVVRYAPDRRERIAVEVLDDGSYSGRYAGGGKVNGCCIDVPTR